MLAGGKTYRCRYVIVASGAREGLDLERDTEGFKIMTKGSGESSIPGLFVLGALRSGQSQAIISAGHGAEAAIEISTRIVEL